MFYEFIIAMRCIMSREIIYYNKYNTKYSFKTYITSCRIQQYKDQFETTNECCVDKYRNDAFDRVRWNDPRIRDTRRFSCLDPQHSFAFLT